MTVQGFIHFFLYNFYKIVLLIFFRLEKKNSNASIELSSKSL